MKQMKHKRMAVLFVLVTFAGSPPMWQKLGNFIAAVQHKAQIKFLSLVLKPGADESDAGDVSITPMTPNELVASNSEAQTPRADNDARPNATSKSRKGRAAKSDAEDAETSRVLAVNRAEKDDNRESLSHLFTLLPQSATPTTAPAVAAVPKALVEAGNAFEFVVLPDSDSVVPVRIDNPAVRLKIKKALEDNKARRQRTRYYIGRPLLAPPASEGGASADEKAG